MASTLDQHPEAVTALTLLHSAAEGLAREGQDRPAFDAVVLDILLVARRLHTVLASLSGDAGEQTTQHPCSRPLPN